MNLCSNRIIQGYHLKVSSVFNAVARSLCICQRLGEIEQLVNCIKSSGTANAAQVCDEVILQSLQLLPEISHTGQLDQLIRLISSTENKVRECFTKIAKIRPTFSDSLSVTNKFRMKICTFRRYVGVKRW